MEYLSEKETSFYIAVDRGIAVKEAIREWKPLLGIELGIITFLLGII